MIRIVLYIITGLLLVSCSNIKNSGHYGVYFDNLETLRGENNKIRGKVDHFNVGDLPQIQRDTVKSGKNAVRLDQKFPYGLNYTVSNVRTDEFVKVSVWFAGPGQLVLVASHDDAGYFYRKSSSSGTNDLEWKEVKLEVSISPDMDREDLKIYVWNPGKSPVYVDDFSIQHERFKSYPDYENVEGIHFLIDTLDMISLERKRSSAFENGILETADDDYVSGLMYYNDSIMPVDIRLKGDWLDHLEGRKWSFRIKVKKQQTWKHVRTFSIHTPVARDFMNEYISHELFRELDILAPRYGFVPVHLNGTSLGIYAWEEHFEKQLVEAMDRREGPIAKFDESPFWVSQKVFIQDAIYFELPFLEAADIAPFKINRTMQDTTLSEAFLLANNLMHQYKHGLKTASEVFDIDKLAGYFALMDLTRGFHGMTWHNQRYYYNPVLCKLEPIFFDAYTEVGIFNPERNAVSGLFNFDPTQVKRFENLFWVRVFQDHEFLSRYGQWLEKYSDPVWLNDFLRRKRSEIEYLESLIKEEFEDYEYDFDFLLENAEKIRNELPFYKDQVEKNPDFAKFEEDKIQYLEYSQKYDSRFPEFYVNAFLEDTLSGSYNIRIENYYVFPVGIIGSGETGLAVDNLNSTPPDIMAFDKLTPDYIDISIPHGHKFIFFKVKGQDDRFSTQIIPYPSGRDYTPEQELFASSDFEEFPFIDAQDKKIIIKEGDYQIDKPLVIPAGYEVIFEPGCKLDFTDGSIFISKSRLTMAGSELKPILISSGDNSCNGFTVLQAEGESRLVHVIFEGLNTIEIDGWRLTGAVNFYESDVSIDRVEFRSNVCEDALNIIRSEFIVSNSKFIEIYADAFDSDYCTGLVEGVSFESIGNDAIDFSGSQVVIRNCRVNDAGDKGVSAGENSQLEVYGTTVSLANIGFASKDQSVLMLDDCSANDINYGLVAFQKKPEYGPGNIRTKGFSAADVVKPYLIEKFSTLNLNGTIIIGQADRVAELFY